MKFLIPVAVGLLLLATGHVRGAEGDDASTPTTVAEVTSTPGGGAATSPATQASGAPDALTTTNGGQPGSTVTGGSSDGTVGTVGTAGTTQAATTTLKPLQLTTLPISNDVNVQDAKSILQHALLLDQQIQSLNTYLLNAQANTDPNTSPLFTQLASYQQNVTAQNSTLQGLIAQLQALQVTQNQIDAQLNANVDTFACFSQSSCVTDLPTTPEPTTPGPTPSVIPCTNPAPLKATSTSQPYKFDSQQNVAQCAISIQASTTTNNVSLTIDANFGGNGIGYVNLVETRTKRNVSLTTNTVGYNFTAFQQVDVYYYSDPRSTVQFNFTYLEVENCDLNCNNGTCRVSTSGTQYCECPKCQATGDFCEIPMGNPCSSKQTRVCGEKYKDASGNQKPYGMCYANSCFDQCYACLCSSSLVNPDSEQSCIAPTSDNFDPPPAVPTAQPFCPTTAAPTTTAAVFTSTLAPAASTSAAGGPSTASAGTGATNAPPTATVAGSTAGGTDAPTVAPTTTATDAPSTSAAAATTTEH